MYRDPRDLHSFPTRRSSDLRGDATWRALERLYSGTLRRWVEIRASHDAPQTELMAYQISYYAGGHTPPIFGGGEDRKSTRLNSSHANTSYAGFCLKNKK